MGCIKVVLVVLLVPFFLSLTLLLTDYKAGAASMAINMVVAPETREHAKIMVQELIKDVIPWLESVAQEVRDKMSPLLDSVKIKFIHGSSLAVEMVKKIIYGEAEM